jgi:hypothetical protein
MTKLMGRTGWVAQSGLVALVIYFGFLAGSRVSAAPRLEIAQPAWNFGLVTNLPELTHDFVISNTGDAPLVITNLLSSCSVCLEVALDKTIISPGGTARLHSQLDLRQLNGEAARAIFFDCNDPQNPSVILEISGTVVPAYQISPQIITLDLSAGPEPATVEILPLYKTHASLSRVFCDASNLEATIAAGTTSGYELTLRAKKTLPHGDSVARVVVSSVDSNDLPCQVVVSVHNPPDLELIPSDLSFQTREDSQTRILWIKQHGMTPMTLLDVIPPSDKFHCEIDPDPDGFDYRIYISTGPLATGMTNALILQMADQQGHKKAVPVPLMVEAQ